MGIALREEEVEEHVSGICFKTGPPRYTGVELEWLVRDCRRPDLAVPVERLDAALAPLLEPGALPGGSRITREPGGQVELSSVPATGPVRCAAAMATDAARLHQAFAHAGLLADGSGLDAHRLPPRVLNEPRYRAMEAYFDRSGPWGRMMMRATASVQINLDAGEDGDGPLGYRTRWLLAHRLGPVLVAAFANSPLWRGRPTGWKSARQAVWARMDACRVRPPQPHPEPRTAWARHALDAQLLCLRRPSPAPWTPPSGLTLRHWLRGAAPAERPPDAADVDYHLSTLFPPVRPRGWLELRMIDAQSSTQWPVPLLVTSALLDDPVASDAACAATEPLAPAGHFAPWQVWLRAARAGPADPLVGRAVRACFAAASDSLARRGVPEPLQEAVDGFAERYAARGRCPGDDQLDALRTGSPQRDAERCPAYPFPSGLPASAAAAAAPAEDGAPTGPATPTPPADLIEGAP